jgi:hypothetical protein
MKSLTLATINGAAQSPTIDPTLQAWDSGRARPLEAATDHGRAMQDSIIDLFAERLLLMVS